MTLERISRALAPEGLMTMGGLSHPEDTTRTILLIGADRNFWETFKKAPEYRDGADNPIDRWSKRVIGAQAKAEQAEAVYPSDGPPYAPFIAWATGTGQFWQSPTGMLVHDRAGLMISIRGALILDGIQAQIGTGQSPCTSCAARPCVRACPVDALSDTHFYDVRTCKAYLGSEGGEDCMKHGCLTRRACPVSQAFERPAAQSAFHMRAFRGT